MYALLQNVIKITYLCPRFPAKSSGISVGHNTDFALNLGTDNFWAVWDACTPAYDDIKEDAIK